MVRLWAVSTLLFTSVTLFLLPAPACSQPGGLSKSIDVRRAERSPEIDGLIEDLWLAAEPATGFVQNQPYEKTAPSESTEVYVLQDDENLYVAFRCHARGHPPTANLTKDEDYVAIRIDPFGSRSTGYFFLVYGSGLFWDGLVLDDGREQDLSWEGVWFRSVRMYPDRMEVEMKIPFKTIRYKKGLSEWGVQFMRHIAASSEDDYWTEVTQKDGDLVSRWGSARQMAPRSSGYYFELYPEGFVRHDDFRGTAVKTKPRGSLNLKWDLTPQTSLNATAYPDFAQIESDPFSVNLSRYPTYLDEQRPFFIEGMEVFRLSRFAGYGFFQPLDIFYSRRIGKSLDGDVVPIIGGAKLTHTTQEWNFGALGALTDAYSDAKEGISEPRRSFAVARARRRVLRNSDVGVLFSGVAAGKNDYDYAGGVETVLRSGASQLIVQGAASSRSGKKGLALTSGFHGYIGRFETMAAYEAVGDSFDVSEIGYVPWAGRQRAMVIAGPRWRFAEGSVRDLYVAPGIIRTREPGSPRWSTMGYFTVHPNLRPHGGANLEMSYGRNYEFDITDGSFVGYDYRSLDFSFWTLLGGNSQNAGCSYSYSYNYQRGYLAYQGQNWLTTNYSFIPPLSVTLNAVLVMEWDHANDPLASWPILRPQVNWRISPYATFTLFNEMVALAPETRFTKSRLQSDRIGMLLSWNFAPKSWLYVALNDYSALAGEPGASLMMRQQYVIGAVKAKYLLYF